MTADVAESSRVIVQNNTALGGIELTVGEIDPSPDATLESGPPLWRWDRDTTVSITYAVSVDEDVEPGVYSFPVSTIDELVAGDGRSIADESTDEVTKQIEIYASRYPYRLLD